MQATHVSFPIITSWFSDAAPQTGDSRIAQPSNGWLN